MVQPRQGTLQALHPDDTTDSNAGWEPLTFARTEDKGVHIERYGEKYIALLNTNPEKISAQAKIDTGKFGLAENASVKKMFSGKNIGLVNSVLNINIAGRETAVIELEP